MREFTSAELAEIFRRSQVCPLGAACKAKFGDLTESKPWPDSAAANLEMALDPSDAHRIAIRWDADQYEDSVQIAQQYGLDALMQEFARRVTA